MDKKISIIVQAIVDGARRNLQGLNKDLNDLGQGSVKVAQQLRAQGVSVKDAGLALGELGYTADEVKETLKAAGYETEKLTSSFDIMGAGAIALKGALVAVGTAFAGIKLAQKAIEIADTAAATVALREGFHRLTAESQVDSQILLESLEEASRGTISEYDLMLQANKAWYLGISQNIAQYSDLMKIAEVKSKDLGMSTLQYWERLNTAIASGYPIGLRQLGIVIDNKRAYEDWAAIIGIAADELDDQQQIQARVNAIIADGESALRRWETGGEDATTATQQFHAAAADLREEFAERLLPILIPGIESLTAAIEGTVDPLQRQRDAVYETAASYDELYRRMSKVAELQQAGGRWVREGTKDWQDLGITVEGVDMANDALIQGYVKAHNEMQEARGAAMRLAQAQDEVAQKTFGSAEKTSAAKDAWMDYLKSVAAENERFASRVAAAQFRAAQAAEQAAFNLAQMEARYQNQRAQAIASAGVSIANAVAGADDRISQIRRDLLDELRDMEWEYNQQALQDQMDYQRQRTDLVKKAPWWIRHALTAEYDERERIRKTGDAEELAEYDKALRERMRLIDPIYAEELDALQEQYDEQRRMEAEEYRHEREVARREARQAIQDAQDAVGNQVAATQAGLSQQLAAMEANYRLQREAWEFQNKQRLEAEKFAMDQLNAEHAQKLEDLLGDLIEHGGKAEKAQDEAGKKIIKMSNKNLRVLKGEVHVRLKEITPEFNEWGDKHWNEYRDSWKRAMQHKPLPAPSEPGTQPAGVGPGLQGGMPYVPYTMPAIIHQGEAVLSVPEAARWREGEGGLTIIIENINLGGIGTAMDARNFGRQIAENLGESIKERKR